jgi:succinate-acetate transporter protein
VVVLGFVNGAGLWKLTDRTTPGATAFVAELCGLFWVVFHRFILHQTFATSQTQYLRAFRE